MALYAFDGTWNDEKDAGDYGKNTNVVRFRDAYAGRQHFYDGVGTRHGWLGKLIGGAFGVGGKERIGEATRDLAEDWAAGDRQIDIVGFSRGSALALHFANVIVDQGVRDAAGQVLEGSPRIRFVGLWDLVAAFGIPIDIGVHFSRINLGYRLSLGPSVAHCFHALALDERRQAFRPTRVDDAYEVWFRGVHADIGGGNENTGLNTIALYWMLKKASALGLPIKPEAVTAAAAGRNADAEIHPAQFDPIKNPWRELRPGDRIHYSVTPRDATRHHNPPADTVVESAEDEANAV